MKDIVTKENWSSDPNNAPLPSDFNRIESNIRKVEENRQEETTARQTADTTLQNNIDSEATARANADSAEAAARIAADLLKAPLASPSLTGNPTAPTQAAGNSSTRLATTAFVSNAVSSEATARANAVSAEATARANADSAEAAARANADSSILSTFVSGSGGVFNRFDLAPSSVWVIPAGLYMIVCGRALQLRDPNLNVWLPGGNPGGLIISDGTNFRITTDSFGGATIAYWKFR
jgi:hypothetical protein